LLGNVSQLCHPSISTTFTLHAYITNATSFMHNCTIHQSHKAGVLAFFRKQSHQLFEWCHHQWRENSLQP
jgi:hypothetical protein